MPLHSSLGNKSETSSQKKKEERSNAESVYLGRVPIKKTSSRVYKQSWYQKDAPAQAAETTSTRFQKDVQSPMCPYFLQTRCCSPGSAVLGNKPGMLRAASLRKQVFNSEKGNTELWRKEHFSESQELQVKPQ
ncbi:hypothetical protein AAY473_037644 [Plecturocebus cupreus]